MCIDDYKLGVKARGFQKSVTVGNAAEQILSSSPDRVGIIISSDETNDIFVSLNQDVAQATGILIPADTKPWEVTLLSLGGIVTMPWFAIVPAGDTSINIIEIILPGWREAKDGR